MGKNSGFVNSGFVKTCNELIIGYNIGRNITNDNKNAFSDHIKKCPGDKPYCKVSTFWKKGCVNHIMKCFVSDWFISKVLSISFYPAFI